MLLCIFVLLTVHHTHSTSKHRLTWIH